MLSAIARHVSLVAGLTGALATAVPGMLLWPRLSLRALVGPFAQYYLLELALVGAVVLVALLTRASASAAAAWTACGLTAAFVAAAGFTIGMLYMPAAGLFALSGALADLERRRGPILHAALAGGAAALQFGVMAAAARMGR